MIFETENFTMKPVKIFFAVTLVFSISMEFAVRTYDLWNAIPFCDKIMHFFWGLNIFMFLATRLRWSAKDAVFGVLAWQVIWEFSEMIGDKILTGQPDHMLDHFFYDGIKDTLMNLAGAFLGLVVIRNKSHACGMRRICPNGSITVLSSCMIATSGIGPALTSGDGYGLNDFAIIALGITMAVYMIYYFLMKQRKSLN